MSRIEDALKKLRKQTPEVSAAAKTTPRSSIPIASKKKVTVEGEKHHVAQADLIAGGLLAPFDQATAVADEFRRIKRPLIVNATSSIPCI